MLKVRLHHVSLGREAPSLKVMLTGDWHISPIVSEQQLEFLKQAIVEADPDVIILQGDIVDSPVELKRETSLKKLAAELKLCAAAAPTVMVLGSHDYITPTIPARVMSDFALPFWKKLCKRTGVQLLMNEWAELSGISIFGAFQDENCVIGEDGNGQKRYQDSADEFLKCLDGCKKEMSKGLKASGVRLERSDKEDRSSEAARSIDETDSDRASFKYSRPEDKVIWFASHAPLLNDAVVKRLEAFDVASFGHTHGGIVPLGLDELFARFNWHFGLISPTHRPFPKHVRGVMPISDSTMMAINPGMIATHFCVSKPLQNMNFIKAAEVSVIEIEGRSKSNDDLSPYF